MRESQEKIRFLTEGLIKMARLESRIIQIRKGSPGSSGDSSGKYPPGEKRGRGKTYRDPPGDDGGRTGAP